MDNVITVIELVTIQKIVGTNADTIEMVEMVNLISSQVANREEEEVQAEATAGIIIIVIIIANINDHTLALDLTQTITTEDMVAEAEVLPMMVEDTNAMTGMRRTTNMADLTNTKSTKDTNLATGTIET